MPDFPVEEAMGGIALGLEEVARARTEDVAREVVSTFAPVPDGGPPTRDGAGPEAQPEASEREAVVSQ